MRLSLMILADLIWHIKIHKRSQIQLYYFRSSDGKEIDLIIESPQDQTFIEIKKSHTFRPEMIKTLALFTPNTSKALLLYCGDFFPSTERVTVMNYAEFLGA